VWCSLSPVVLCLCSLLFSSSPPAAGGVRPPFIDQEGANHMRAALSSYMKGRGVLCCRVGGRPDDPCSDPAIMAYLVPEQWRFEGRRAADGGDVF
jgi:hypothetical protein